MWTKNNRPVFTPIALVFEKAPVTREQNNEKRCKKTDQEKKREKRREKEGDKRTKQEKEIKEHI